VLLAAADRSDPDHTACRELLEAHPGPLVTTDQHLGGVDSSLVAIAERLGATSIGTLERRHFGLVRPQHIAGFELLPYFLAAAPTASFAGLHELASLGHGPAPPHPFNQATTPTTRTLRS
jgi:hypothetical protein